MGEQTKHTAVDIAWATTKGVISQIPFLGSILSEYIGVAQNFVANKRQKEWIDLIEGRLSNLEEDKRTEAAKNEFNLTALQIATTGAMKSYQAEKRKLFANAFINSIQLDYDSEKKETFLYLLDKYTLSHIAIIKEFASVKADRQNALNPFQAMGSRISRLDYLNDDLVLLHVKTLVDDGILLNQGRDFYVLNCATSDKYGKFTTPLGDEFINFITEENMI
jgi:hypothetical protein